MADLVFWSQLNHHRAGEPLEVERGVHILVLVPKVVGIALATARALLTLRSALKRPSVRGP